MGETSFNTTQDSKDEVLESSKRTIAYITKKMIRCCKLTIKDKTMRILLLAYLL